MISLSDIDVELDGGKILGGVSFTSVADGVVAIMGPSGCGKSTLLKALMGLVKCSGGQIKIGEKICDAAYWNTKQSIFTLVPQVPLLLPWLSLLDNIRLAGESDKAKDEVTKKATDLLEIVGLSESGHLFPWQVSQGMAARASLARTLMIESQVLLLDEPFAAIDATTRFRLQQWLLATIAKLKIQAMMVTHDPREALLIADKIIVLRGRPAKVGNTFDLPERSARNSPDWIFGEAAGQLEKQIRAALDG
jgi:NitT/TauT family transport system ATP-binding protein